MKKHSPDSKVPTQKPEDDVFDEVRHDDYMADRECRADSATDIGRVAAEFSAKENVTFFTRDRK